MRIGIADADLIENINHRFPNTCSMRFSSFYKALEHEVVLITNWKDVQNYDKVYISKVFTETVVPEWVLKLPNIVFGGSGFYYPNIAPDMPYEIEHCMPDYHLYDKWVEDQIRSGKNKNEFVFYLKCSIGKLTKHCFNKCYFCINQHYDRVLFNAHLSEFYDSSREIIILLDDQFWGYSGWEPLLDEVIETGKPFQFKQGLDIRVLTERKLKKLLNSNHHKDYIFAFDNVEEKEVIERKLSLWRRYTQKRTKLYVFCGTNPDRAFDELFWINDLKDVFERIFILAKYDCTPYIMRHLDYKLSPFKTIYTEIASWCNQPWALRTMSYRQYCIGRGMGKQYKQYKHDPERYLKDGHKKGSQWIAMEKFETKYPEVAAKYFDLNYRDFILKIVA